MATYGRTEEEIQELINDGRMENKDGILCMACFDEDKIKRFARIQVKHLACKHPDEFPDVQTARKHYERIYPNAPTSVTPMSEIERDLHEEFQSLQNGTFQESLEGDSPITPEWALMEARRKYEQLDNLLGRFDDANDMEGMVDTLKAQLKILKENWPARKDIPRPGSIKPLSDEDRQNLRELGQLIRETHSKSNEISAMVLKHFKLEEG